MSQSTNAKENEKIVTTKRVIKKYGDFIRTGDGVELFASELALKQALRTKESLSERGAVFVSLSVKPTKLENGEKCIKWTAEFSEEVYDGEELIGD